MMDGQMLVTIFSGLLIACGVVALLIGSLGLLRLPDVYCRIHAVGMIDTAGASFIILGMIIHEGFTLVTVKLVLIGVFMFFTSIVPEGISVMPDIRSYLDFVLKLFFAFGLSFEIPIAVVILSWMGAVDPDNLAKKRPYVFVLCFILGMLLTPPDIISQTLLAIPMWLLFEVGILFGRMVAPKKEDEESLAE